ncbi:DNA ligase D [Bacillus piscicola]|uniref:DNA ligase D n=1 Tax=Bacillus piscicola TaxID=1632684 RepID=UPI001F098447|nr:DNA ligase D [Bacillus piscicola]
MKWMKPTRITELPSGKYWVYEMKYDGYRAKFVWDGERAALLSKSGHSLENRFPEIVATAQDTFSNRPPFALDGELAVLVNHGRADFYALQRRALLRTSRTIQQEMKAKPAVFLAFDILQLDDADLRPHPWSTRQNKLEDLLNKADLPLLPDPHAEARLQGIPSFKDMSSALEENRICCGEGIVVKNKRSSYKEGRTDQWLKYKTPFVSEFFITAYDPANDYFYLAVWEENTIVPAGKCSHGFLDEEKNALIATIKKNGIWNEKKKVYEIAPSIVVEAAYTTRKKTELREPRFSQFRFDTPVTFCTAENLALSDLRFPEDVEVTNPDKALWPGRTIRKVYFLGYVRRAAPYILPFLKARPLTVIRYPHGLFDKGFFQKDCPDYAPDYVETAILDDNDYIVCNNIKTLLWLANQLALEWHVPFQRLESDHVDEIVFDLDPPGTDYFKLAIKGALLLKELCDSFGIVSFVKFSGNKGLQVYIPLPENTFTWTETNKITETFGTFLTEKHPDLFTQERLKKNRGRKLYLDIPQHREGKTIIAPYSLRGKEDPLIACPLFWEEVSPKLDRTAFTMEKVLDRLMEKGCPFQEMENAKKEQPIHELLRALM